jgi:hypothetical protein
MNSEQRKAAKAGLRASLNVGDAIERSLCRAEEVGGEEYLAIIGADAWTLAKEVQELRQRNSHLVSAYNSLLETMRIQQELTAQSRPRYPNMRKVS